MHIPKPLSLHPLVRTVESDSGGTATATLPFVAQEQSQTNWCWAAVSTSVGLYYGTGNWTQCIIATVQVNSILDPGGNHDCCTTPGSSTCNQYGYLNPALQNVGAFAHSTSGKAPADHIFARISQRREVVCVRVAWGGGGAHFTTIHGFTDPSSGGEVYLTVSDTIPGWGTTTMLYSDFPRQYKHGGNWTDTYWTRNVLGPSTEYGTGERNTVALDNNANCVALHVRSRQIYSHVGRVDFINQEINWGPVTSYGAGDSVAIDVDDFGQCVGVHADGGRLHYRVGMINTNTATIDWGASAEYASGVHNEIAQTVLGLCVSVYVDGERLYYRMGWIEEDRSISWMPQVEYGSGVSNTIALDEDFNCVEAHVGSGPESGRLFYRVGQLDVLNSVISWGPSVEFDTGTHVDITMDNNQRCRSVHVDNVSGSSGLFYRLGTVDVASQTIEWAPRTQYDSGANNSVGLDDSGKSVEVHANSGRLFSKVGQ